MSIESKTLYHDVLFWASSSPHRQQQQQQQQLNTIFYSLAYVVVHNITQTK